MSRVTTCKNFRQADSRWGRLTYPSAPDYMADSGCGATSCADLIVSNPKHKSVTPKTIRNYMVKNGYAIKGQGTAWAGIPACLKAYGFKVTNHPTMNGFFEEMKKTGRMGVILFRGGTKGGVTWTSVGHYVACSGMKIQNNKHYLYTLDPGPRKNDGWHAYETTMKGLIVEVWSCYLPETNVEKTSTTPTTTKKTTTTKTKEVEHKATYKVVEKTGMNVRKDHNTKAAVVGTVGYSKSFKTTKKYGDWVYAPTLKGWVCIKQGKTIYLKKI